eukprot:TRINITY_DN25145_c0_g1_i1.p1 TRINITY_DN25145_c0_g1~~TRINITY_DN25145_c0_g1_i1.p1  ORF type:complete len:283 (+),score=77.65 TRINITY_DN25145_c0_g1_i1:26-850(+)
MPRKTLPNPEDDEFEEADAILAELRRKAETGESDLPWGDCADRSWDDGVLRVTREYAASSQPLAAKLLIRETPYSAHPLSGVGGTGGVVWPGALTLADLLRERQQELLGATEVMLEIGAGCGLAGLCAASLLAELPVLSSGARRVILTDGPEAVMENLQWNVEANVDRVGRLVHLEAARLAWEELLDGSVAPPVEEVDLLLGSDVIWGGRGPMVAQVARRLVKPGGWLAISAQKGREGLDEFEAVLRGVGEELHGPDFRVEQAFQIFVAQRHAL